jgi:chaperone protein EcpD
MKGFDRRFAWIKWNFALIFCLCVNLSHASVVIVGTRVIYSSDARDVSVRLLNNGGTPALVQAWIDTGDASVTPELAKAPFILTPPLARMDPSKGQTLRMMYTGTGLPSDKESLFWLNILEIPPRPQEADNYLQFAVRTRIKIFYRPVQLSKFDSANAITSADWSAKNDGKTVEVKVTNRSPFYISMSQVRLAADGKDVGKPMNVTVAPGATELITFSDVDIKGGIDTAIRYQVINDYGSPVDGEHSLVINK